MPSPTTHVRLSRPANDRLAKISDETGIPRTTLLERIVTETLDAIDSDEPPGATDLVVLVRRQRGTVPSERTEFFDAVSRIEGRLDALAPRKASPKARKTSAHR